MLAEWYEFVDKGTNKAIIQVPPRNLLLGVVPSLYVVTVRLDTANDQVWFFRIHIVSVIFR